MTKKWELFGQYIGIIDCNILYLNIATQIFLEFIYYGHSIRYCAPQCFGRKSYIVDADIISVASGNLAKMACLYQVGTDRN